MFGDRSTDVAVIGVAARFPGPPDLNAWWRALMEGRLLLTTYTREELLLAGAPRELVEDPDYVPRGGFLPDVDRFDHVAFRMSVRESETTDPQHRLALETARRGLQDAGVDIRRDRMRTAVFASATGSSYLRRAVLGGVQDPATLDDFIHGCDVDFMASRLSYKLGLTGPALAVQTACSSSLVGVHLAVRALNAGDCDQAVVVASGITYPQAGYLHLPGGVLSSTGRCRPFDAEADGVVGGAGVACVVLRRVVDVDPDGPEPHGVILGSATNNDGSLKAGYFAPSPSGQADVIRAALGSARVDAGSVGYLETHGTGTLVGDPIEWSAASRALTEAGAEPGQVLIGAVKANIGHLDACAGLAGLIKALFVVRSGDVPPVAGFRNLNPLLEATGSPLTIPDTAASWTGPLPRVAGVSAFGIGGSNAHVIVAEHTRRRPTSRTPESRRSVVLLSGTDDAAAERELDCAARVSEAASGAAATVARSFAHVRDDYSFRRALLVADGAAREVRPGSGADHSPPASGGRTPLVFVFGGQGTQRPGMATGYSADLPDFDDHLEDVLTHFESRLRDRVRSAVVDADYPAEELGDTELAQPALFAVQVAAYASLVDLGLRPAACVGHSLGELSAACASGLLDVSASAAFVAARGRAMQSSPDGAMLAVALSEAEVLQAIDDSGVDLDVASLNEPGVSVVAGTESAVQEFFSALGGNVWSRRLKVNRAFHSRLLDDCLGEIARASAGLVLRPAEAVFASTSTVELFKRGERAPRAIFVDQARRQVRFGQTLELLSQHLGPAVVVDVGPGQVMTALSQHSFDSAVTLCPEGRAASERPGPARALAELWVSGYPLDRVRLAGSGGTLRIPAYWFAGPRTAAPEVVSAPPPTPGDPRMAGTGESAPAPKYARPTPRTPARQDIEGGVETFVLSVWQELLGGADLGPESDFFASGGDSMSITRLARRVNHEYGIRVPVRSLLLEHTLGRQVTLIKSIVGREPAADA